MLQQIATGLQSQTQLRADAATGDPPLPQDTDAETVPASTSGVSAPTGGMQKLIDSYAEQKKSTTEVLAPPILEHLVPVLGTCS